MELIYLFINNYKAINNKEISLSSQFQVKKENDKFTVSRSSIPDDFFSRNIDIVSFFGTNGSGKSTTIEFILHLYENNMPNGASFVAIFEELGDIFYISKGLNNTDVFNENSEPVRIYQSDLEIEDFVAIYFSHALEPLAVKSTFKNKKIINCSNTSLLSRAYLQKYKDVKSQFDLFKNVNLSFLKVHDVPMLGSINLMYELSKRLRNITSTINNISYIFNNNEIIKHHENDDLRFLYSHKNMYDSSDQDVIPLLAKFIEEHFLHENSTTSKNPITSLIYISLLNSTLTKSASIISRDNHSTSSKAKLDVIESANKTLSILTELARSLYNDSWYENINMHLSDLLFTDFPKKLEKEVLYSIEMRYDIYSFDRFVRERSIPSHTDHERFTFGVNSYNEFMGITELISNLRSALSCIDIKWNGISSGQYSALTMYSK